MNNNELAQIRTALAAERTFFSILKTGLGTLALGWSKDKQPLIYLGLAFIAIGAWQYYQQVTILETKHEGWQIHLLLVGLLAGLLMMK